MVGYRRFEGLEAAALLAQLYRSARMLVNFFQPSFKLVRKERDGARVHKTYSAPATPHQRLVAEARTPDAVRARVNEFYAGVDPVALLGDIRAVQEQLANLTDAAPASHPTAMPPIEQFLSSLRIAWKDGTPTDRAIEKPKRERRCPDPLVKATPQRREWFETSSELLSNLQAENPRVYPRKVLRTLQRRLKLWRREQASALVFGSGENAAQSDVIVTSPESPPLLDEGTAVRSRPVIDRAQGWRVAPPPSAAGGLDHARSPVCWLCKRSVEDRARHRRARNAQLRDRLPSLPG